MEIPSSPHIGDAVLILYPAYAAGRMGVICGREDESLDPLCDRWLVQADDLILSLYPSEFRILD
ncbi:MAG: hypothetical protein KME20_20415 [Kaiparowitsia implicata GSE-PSE-MK54-09C]|nr:hypothetical protein [Kaiparowitsia implicata GSE-PSE-MK54-09C]